jgi:hypothetical protein
MGENGFASAPTAAYGFVLLMAAVAYRMLQHVIIRSQGQNSMLLRAVGHDWKGRVSEVLYITGVVVSRWQPYAAAAIYTVAAIIWLVPDRRIERAVRV